MGHFARINDNNVVCEVIVVSNAAMNDQEFPISEIIGQSMLRDSGFDGIWLQCSYSSSFRGAFPAAGWIYDNQKDIFLDPTQDSTP